MYQKQYGSVFRHITSLWIKRCMRCAQKLALLGILFWSGWSVLYAQSISELENQRLHIQQKINLTNQLLKDTKNDKAEAYAQYTTLQAQIKQRQALIATLQSEIAITNQSIQRSSEVVSALQDDILHLQNEYGQMLRAVYRQKMTQSPWWFILSADNFNDAFLRWQYVRQYDAYRQKQAQLIQVTQQTLIQKLDVLQQKKDAKNNLILTHQAQTEILTEELHTRNDLYQVLQKNEKRLRNQLKKQIANQKKLDAAIQTIIIAATTTPKSVVSFSSNPSTITVVHDKTPFFAQQKGQLPWPVQSGVITQRFGEQAHPTLSGIRINNNGIDIKTTKQEKAYAVFDGEVVGTQFIPGYQHTLILKHGEYFTVYSNLENLLVKKSQRVQQGQALGIINTHPQKKDTQIHFEVWRKKQRLNPSDWLK